MKSRHPILVNSAMICLANIVCMLPARAEIVLLDLQREPQKQSNWCWAAVSAMAGHSFNKKVDDMPISQENIVNFELLDIKTQAKFASKKAQILQLVPPSWPCSTENSLCNRTGETFLYEINGLIVPEGRVLKKQYLIDEVTKPGRKRPIIVKWDYTQVPDPQGSLPRAEHYLIITGYNSANGLFRVFDPWSGPDQTLEGNEQWISYSGYLDPQVNLGAPIAAVHSFDVFNLRAGSGSLKVARSRDPAHQKMPATVPVMLVSVGFDQLDAAKTAVSEELQKRSFYTREGQPITRPVRFGQMYPIVVLSTGQIQQNKTALERLLEPRASSAIATVVAGNENSIVGSLLVYNDNGTWKVAEYSNTQVSRLLETVREAHPIPNPTALDTYYLVSMPEQATFYSARGYQAAAQPWALDNDPQGMPGPAHGVLREFVERLESTPPRTVRKNEQAQSAL